MGTGRTCDAIVIGSGPNGLVAANALADAGWEVVVLEAQPQPGGAVRSGEPAAAGYTHDLYSSFYPLAAASPVLRDLDLHRHGLEWQRAPHVLAHQCSDGRAAVMFADPDRTAAALDEDAAGDGASWLELFGQWRGIRDDLLDALFTPFPPVRAARRLWHRLGAAGALRMARLAATPVRRLAQERFQGEAAQLLLTGNALHADIPPDAAGSGLFGWLLSMLGQDVGFPVPRGGAGRLADALVSRATSLGAELHCDAPVAQVLVRSRRAYGVRLHDGRVITARAVLADVAAPALYQELLADVSLPSRLREDLRAFDWDPATLKVNWAVRGPLPWLGADTGRAGTVHLGVDLDGFVDFAADLSVGRVPGRPFVLFGQPGVADPSRAPTGGEAAWAYTHLPRGVAARPEVIAAHVATVEAAIEEAAPGFADLVVARHVQTPTDLEAGNASLVGGAINAGTAAIHQQLVFRPTPGLGRPETPIEGLFLASASAHPGGGVHGACGWNAARAALSAHGGLGAVKNALARTVWARVLNTP